jgi:hypothetical protein
MIVKYVLFLLLKKLNHENPYFFLFLNKSCFYMYIKLRLIVIVSIKNKSTI